MDEDALFALLESADLKDRMRAWALASEQGAASVPDLLAFLGRPDLSERSKSAAILALSHARASSPPARDAVTAFLADPSAEIRYVSALALGAIGDETSRAVLEPMLNDHAANPHGWFEEDATVAHAAQAALSQLDKRLTP